MNPKIAPETSYALDVLRVIACFMVVLLHVSATQFYQPSPIWHEINIINAFTRICVPIFIMITGVLLIKPDINYRKLWQKLKKILMILLFWSAFYLWDAGKVSDASAWIKLIAAPAKYHLWYLYAMVGFYLAIPLLSKIYYQSNKQELTAYLAIWGWVAFIGSLVFYELIAIDVLKLYQLGFLANFVGYLVLGKVLVDYYQSPNKAWLCLFGFVVLCLLSAQVTYVFFYHTKPRTVFYEYSSIFVLLEAICFFLFVLKISPKWHRIQKWVQWIAPYTLGIYLIHVFFMGLNPYPVTGAVSAVLLSVLIFCMSLISVWLLKKIKYVRACV